MSYTDPRTRCDKTIAWGLLQEHFRSNAQHLDLRTAFAQNSKRFADLSQSAPYLFADLSKNLIDARTQALLFDLARQTGLEKYRDAMFTGELINQTEQRAVMHFLLRNYDLGLTHEGNTASETIANALPQVHAVRQAMLAYAERVRSDDSITDIVNIGIGGSDLGPKLAVQALGNTSGKRLHFVSNIDGYELQAVLRTLQPHSTLFVVASKTFTTTETLLNARLAWQWFEAQGGQDIAHHFVALTAHAQRAHDWGIPNTLLFWDWVGGRYSLCSAIGLPLAIALGQTGFTQFLAGACSMDEHFRTAVLENNLPVRLGLLDVWYRNFYGYTSRSIAPYDSRLRSWPAYLQQLEMESNGKHVDAQGQTLPFASAPVLWGETGVNGQHAYFQMLHQGSDVIPVEFVLMKKAPHELEEQHQHLLANALGQAQALMDGRTTQIGHQHFSGNRPSTFLLLDDLSPASLGALIALQEHRVFVSGAIWGINSFDQWGVELGKVLAADIAARLHSGDISGLDGSTAGLLQCLGH